MEGHEMDLVHSQNQNAADQEMLDATADDTKVNSTLTPQLEHQQPKPKVKNVTEVNNNNNNNAGEVVTTFCLISLFYYKNHCFEYILIVI